MSGSARDQSAAPSARDLATPLAGALPGNIAPPAPRSTDAPDVTRFVVGRRGEVAFTFDDGPHHLHTARLLKILEEHDAPATFFVNGCWLAEGYRHGARNREILRAAHRAGHIIGNHTTHHVNITRLGREDQTAEILGNGEAIAAVIGVRPTFFRPPYAVLSRHALAVLRDHEYVVARWNSAVHEEEERPVEEIRDSVMAGLRHHDGGIVMLHDRNRRTVDAMALILRGLRKENCRRRVHGQRPLRVVPLDSFLQSPTQSPLETRGQPQPGTCDQL